MNNFQESIQALLSSIKIKNNIVYLNDKTVNNSDDLTIDLVSRLQSVIYEFYTRRKDATPLNENTLWREKRWEESFVSAETQYFSTWRTTNSKLTSCISLSGVCQAENGIERIVENSTRYIFLGQDKETQQFVVRVAQERFLIGNAKKEDDNKAYNWIFGEKTFPSQNSLPTTLRFYFNLIPNQVRIESFIYDLKYLFDTWEIPFAFKFLGIYNEYQRADSAVLYVSQKYFYLILWLIQILHNKYYPIDAFNDEIPHFTYPVFKGIGFAENPEVDEEISFGTFRSRKLANIIITLTKNGSQELPTLEVFLEAIRSDISF